MSWVHSRRNFLLFTPGVVALCSMAQGALAQNPPQGGSTTNPNSNRPAGSRGGAGGFGGGGSGGGGIAPGPGPAARDGDFKPGRASGMHDQDHTEPPSKPRKDLATDQKNMRQEVQQLVRNTQELKNALEQVGPKQRMPAELIGKTKEIEKLAHEIAALAKD
jgi:hypothetical protein